MAIIRGGLHGRASGNVAGVVYGAARTRTGKVVTARELVYPSNPNTAAQQLQRSIFKQSLYAVRHIGPSGYQDDWNRAIGQLPGFQSLMSIFLDNTNASEEFVAPPDTPLGNLHFPSDFLIETGAGAASTVTITFNNNLGLNGTLADVLVVIYSTKDVVGDDTRPTWFSVTATTRDDSPLVLNVAFAATDMVVCGYFRGAGAAEGNLSLCDWTSVTSHA